MLKKNKHKEILIRVLKDIYSDTSLNNLLGFKGGTAAYLFYDLPRFSVDLDFDLLDREKDEFVYKKVKEILLKYGVIKDEKNKRNRILLTISFDEDAQNIKLEINKENFGSEYEIKTYLGISMMVIKKEDMFAHKLVAAYERIGRANRDIYDIWYFCDQGWSINENIIKRRTGNELKEFLDDLISKLNNKERNLLEGMGELIDDKQKDWVRDKLKEETLFSLRLKRDNIEK